MVEVGMEVVVVESKLVEVVKAVEVRGVVVVVVVEVNKQVAGAMVEAEEESTQVAAEVEVVKGEGESILAAAAEVVIVE